jgi:chromate transport protein ChrA
MATFVGFRVAGIAGAVAATVGVFQVPWLLATGAAHVLRHAIEHPWVQAFGRGAARLWWHSW